jgi:hypothetical protein
MLTYITFGQSHRHVINDTVFDRDCVAVIEAKNEAVARRIAFDAFGGKFCFSYPDSQWDETIMWHFPRGKIPLNIIEETH